jgi:hypothetical protein
MWSRYDLKLNTSSCLIMFAVVIIFVSLGTAPAFSVTPNLCSSCHGSFYSQQLDILEGNSQNNIPTTLQVDQTQTVTVAIQNINTAPIYSDLSSVSVMLASQNGHFYVHTPTVNIGTLPTGTATATFEITGYSPGSDAFLISVSAINTHKSVMFSDNYSPAPSITVVPDPNSEATPFSTPAPTSLPSSTAHSSIIPTTPPSPTTSPTTVVITPSPIPSISPSSMASAQPTPTPSFSMPQVKKDPINSNLTIIFAVVIALGLVATGTAVLRRRKNA